MYCSKCGKEIAEGTKTCPDCGVTNVSLETRKVIDGVKNWVNDFSTTIEEEYSKEKVQDIKDEFVSSGEILCGILGEGYFGSFVRGAGLSKGFGFFTNKRFYFKGKCFSNINGRLHSIKKEVTVDLQDITATEFVYTRNIYLLVSTIISAVLGLLFRVDYEDGWALALWILALALLSIYIGYRRVAYTVRFAGGDVTVKTAWYGLKKVQSFDKNLRRAKDNVIYSMYCNTFEG